MDALEEMKLSHRNAVEFARIQTENLERVTRERDEARKERDILLEVVKVIAHDDACGQHHDAMAQDGLRRAYTGDASTPTSGIPQEGDAGQP